MTPLLLESTPPQVLTGRERKRKTCHINIDIHPSTGGAPPAFRVAQPPESGGEGGNSVHGRVITHR